MTSRLEKGFDMIRSGNGDTRSPESTIETPEKKARDIAEKQNGNYDAIVEELTEKNLFDAEKKRIQSNVEYQKYLQEASFLTEKEWEMLTVLELFDVETFKHCLRTYEKAREMIESEGVLGTYLKQNIDLELQELSPSNRLSTLYRACLFHDLGKIAVPKSILNNPLRNDDWLKLGEQFCTHTANACYQKRIRESHGTLRAKDIVPLRVCLTEGESIRFQVLGIDVDLPLGQIINAIHTKQSAAYLEKAGFLTEAALVKEHHSETPIAQRNYPVSSSTITVTNILQSLLHTADVYDAMQNARSYKGDEGIFETLAILIQESEKKLIDPKLLSLLLEFELKKLARQVNTRNEKLSSVTRAYFKNLQSKTKEKPFETTYQKELFALKKVHRFFKETGDLRKKASIES